MTEYSSCNHYFQFILVGRSSYADLKASVVHAKAILQKKLTEGRLRKLLKHGLFLGRVY